MSFIYSTKYRDDWYRCPNDLCDGLPVEERRIAIDEVVAAFRSGELEEVFGAGTAAVICPVASIGFKGEVFQVASTPPGELTLRLYDELTSIQYGKLADRHGWNVAVSLPQASASSAATQAAG